MTWPLIIIGSGILVTVALWAIFVYIAVREIKTEMPDGSFAGALDVQRVEPAAPMKVLVPIDGSAASIAAVHDVAHCPLLPDSTMSVRARPLSQSTIAGTRCAACGHKIGERLGIIRRRVLQAGIEGNGWHLFRECVQVARALVADHLRSELETFLRLGTLTSEVGERFG